MAITFTCECGKQLRVRDSLAHKKGKCPACGRTLMVPGIESERAERYLLE
jgi:predicted RNA-binding Zn-ribbon protein involved in translation (DUF1610 family)